MNASYQYASGRLIDNTNSYFYTPYQGREFLDAWRNEREHVLETLPVPIPPRPSKIVDRDSRETHHLLELAIQGDSKLLQAFVKKFEVSKRIHSEYDTKFSAVDRGDRYNLGNYLRAADLFEMNYSSGSSWIHLNVLFKCLDTICAYVNQLDQIESARLAWHILRERQHVMRLVDRFL